MAKHKKQKNFEELEKIKNSEEESILEPLVELEDTFDEDVDESSSQEVDEEDNKKPKTISKAKISEEPAKQSSKPRLGLGEELMEVYEASGDTSESMSLLERKKKSWKRMLSTFILFLLAVFVGVAAVSWYIFGRSDRFDVENVSFELQAPEELASGEAVTFVVTYGNNESVTFANTQIELRFPSGFIFESANPEPTGNEDQNVWELGAMSAGENGNIEVKGVLVGKEDQTSTLSGVMRYHPANFSSEFQEISSVQTKILPSQLEFRLEGPEEVLAGEEVGYTVVYNNPREENPYENLEIKFFYPQGFIVKETSVELEDSQSTLEIAELLPDDENEILVKGVFSEVSDDPFKFFVEISLRGSVDSYILQKQEEIEVNVIGGDLVVNTIANGTNNDSHLRFGDTIHGAITLLNNSETTLEDLELSAVFETRYKTNSATENRGPLDWESLTDVYGGSLKDLQDSDTKTIRRRSITWDSSDVDDLELLEPEAEVTIDFQIDTHILDKVRSLIDHPEDVEIILLAVAKVGKTGGVRSTTEVNGVPLRFAFDSDTILDSQARYFDEAGNQLGSGVLPPKVGEKTIYKVIWDISNSLHEVEDIMVTAELPDNVSWLDSYEISAGDVTYDTSKQQILWRLNRMPLNVETVNISFDLELDPTSRQVGDVAPLVKKTTITSKDTVTGGQIVQIVNPLNTGVSRDDFASDKGLVVE